MQAKYYYVYHIYVSKHSELSNVAMGADKEILETAVKLKMGDKFTAEQLTVSYCCNGAETILLLIAKNK